MVLSLREFTRFIWWMQTDRQMVSTLKPSQLTWPVSPPVGCYHPHLPSPFTSITQPKSWCSFYHPTEGGRLSRPRHWVCSPCPRLYRLSQWDLNLGSFTPVKHIPLDHCNLQRHVGVNNLPNVVTRQHGGRESNLQPLNCKSNTLTTKLLSHPSVVAIQSTTNLDLHRT